MASFNPTVAGSIPGPSWSSARAAAARRARRACSAAVRNELGEIVDAELVPNPLVEGRGD